MRASDVKKWDGKACVVTLKQGSVLACEDIVGLNCAPQATRLIMDAALSIHLAVYCHEIKSIDPPKARKK